MSGECVTLLSQVLDKTSPVRLAMRLGLAAGTINRWIEQQQVPTLYKRDLLRLLGKKTTADGDKRDKDQFYTQRETALDCLRRFRKVSKELSVNLNGYTFIEPAAGAGAFYKKLPPTRRIGLDIEPACRGVETADYLTWKPRGEGKYIVVGNPPFGLRGHLALQFINHSAAFADMVAFILPPLFNSDGKGVPAKRVKGYQLAHTSRLTADSFEYPDGTPVDVESIFQVWTRVKTENIRLPKPKTCKSSIKVYSLSDGGTPSSTRNKKMLHACDIYLPSTCFSGMHVYKGFEDLPHRRGYGVVIHRQKREIKKLLANADWEKAAFKSTNGALNLRTGLIEAVLTSNGIHD